MLNHWSIHETHSNINYTQYLSMIIFPLSSCFCKRRWRLKFKIKVHIDIRNSNTSSILIKQSCLLRITWLKKVIPTKSYSLVVALSSPHKIFKSCTTPMTSQAIVSYFWCSQIFSIFTQYMSVSHGHSTICGIEWWLWEHKKGEDSLTSTRRINGLWRCPSIDINVSE